MVDPDDESVGVERGARTASQGPGRPADRARVDVTPPSVGDGDHAAAGHPGHTGHGDHVGEFRRLFWIMLLLAIPTVGLSEMFASIVGAGLPIALSYGAMGLEFSVGQLAGAAWRYWREPRSYLPGPGEQPVGYRVQPEVTHTHPATRPDGRELPTGGEPLWDL